METQKFLYFILILKIFTPECAGSPVNEPLSAHNDSMLETEGNAENTQINIGSNITNDNTNNFSYHTIGNQTNERGGILVQNFCNEKDDNLKKIVQLEEKIDEVMGITKKVQETNKSVLLENKIDELMSKTKKEQESNLEKSTLLENKINGLSGEIKEHTGEIKELTGEIKELTGEIKEQRTNMEKVLKMLNEIIVQKKNSQASSLISKQANCDDKSPAFTGSSYLAIDAPGELYNFSMSMEVKATAPVTDGIIMYCAEKLNFGGFMSLAVRQGRLEFRFYLGWNYGPVIVLTADRTLPANEWTNIEVSRVGYVVSLRINSGAALEGRLSSNYLRLFPDTPLFIGGVDGSTVLRNKTAVSGGFKGCIKGAQVNMNDNIRINNIETAASKSNKVQKCCYSNDE